MGDPYQAMRVMTAQVGVDEVRHDRRHIVPRNTHGLKQLSGELGQGRGRQGRQRRGSFPGAWVRLIW